MVDSGEAGSGIAGANDSEHIHHWMISAQTGPISEGVCKECGAHKAFENAFKRSYGAYARSVPPSRLRREPPETH